MIKLCTIPLLSDKTKISFSSDLRNGKHFLIQVLTIKFRLTEIKNIFKVFQLTVVD